MKRRITKRKKNPYKEKDLIDQFSQFSDIKFLSSGLEARIYKFTLDKSVIFSGILLKSGQYVLKVIYDEYCLDKENIERLFLLSKYGVIPHIYFINENIIIMKYIDGEPFYYWIKDHRKDSKKLEIINYKINKLIEIWEKLGLYHEDLNNTNILITKDLKVYFIDPKIYWKYE